MKATATLQIFYGMFLLSVSSVCYVLSFNFFYTPVHDKYMLESFLCDPPYLFVEFIYVYAIIIAMNGRLVVHNSARGQEEETINKVSNFNTT